MRLPVVRDIEDYLRSNPKYQYHTGKNYGWSLRKATKNEGAPIHGKPARTTTQPGQRPKHKDE